MRVTLSLVGRSATGGRGFGMATGATATGSESFRASGPRRGPARKVLTLCRFEDHLQAVNPARRRSGGVPDAARPQELHVGIAEGLREIMRGLANLRFRLLHAERVSHGAIDPGAAVSGTGPCALVQSGQHRYVGADEACFEKAQNGERSFVTLLRPHGKAVQPVTDDGGGAGQVAGTEEARLLAQELEGLPQHVTTLAQPESLAGDLFASLSETVQMVAQALRRIVEQRRQDVRNLHAMSDGLFPLLLRYIADQQMKRVAIFAGEAKRVRELADFRCTGSGAQQCEFNDARMVPCLFRRQAECCEVVAQEGCQCFGGEILQQAFEQEIEQRGATEADERFASGIIDRHVPALELHLHAARELAVGCDEASGPARGFEALAQNQGSGRGLLGNAPRLDELHALHGLGHAVLLALERRMPEVRCFGGAHQFAHQPVAGAGLRLAEFAHILPLRVEPHQELLQRMLRMGGAKREPARLVHHLVEAGEHHGAIGKARDGFQQFARRGYRSGRACRNEGKR